MALDAATAVPNCGVYFYRTRNGWVKIGHSANQEKRLGQHRTTEPDVESIDMIDTADHAKCETFLKKYFESRRVRGTKECFDLSSQELQDGIVPPRHTSAQRYRWKVLSM